MKNINTIGLLILTVILVLSTSVSQAADSSANPPMVNLCGDCPDNPLPANALDNPTTNDPKPFTSATPLSPPTQGLPTDLGDLIQKIFTWSLSILGIAVFVMFFYSGFLWLTAAGNTAKIGEARTHMTNAVFGAILLLSSYLILYTINPDFVKNSVNLPGLGTTTSNNNGEDEPLPCDAGEQPTQYDGAVNRAISDVVSNPSIGDLEATKENIGIFRDALIENLKLSFARVGRISKDCSGKGEPGSDALIIGTDDDEFGEVCDITRGLEEGETKQIKEVARADCGEHTGWERLME